MKKITYFSGYLFTLIFVLGAYFKLAQLENSNLFMLTGVTGLALIFVPLLLLGKKDFRVGSVIKWTFIASLYALIFWWDLLRWSGAGEIITLGVLFFGVGFLPYFFLTQYKKSLVNR